MPTYEYRCPRGHEFERILKITDTARVKCPQCGRVAQRIISGGAGLIFKGSGFYITDYGKDGKGPARPSEAESKAESPASSEATPNPEKPSSGEKSGKPSKKSGKKAKP